MKHILVVDNHVVITRFLESFLKEKGYTVSTAAGGIEALDILEKERPDIAFVDLVMPGIGGEKFCSLVKGKPEHSSMIIVILSAIAVEYPLNPVELNAHFGIAKAPFPLMGKNILEVLAEIERPEGERRYGKVWGTEDVFGRHVVSEILETHRHLVRTVERIPEGVFEIDENHRILLVNPAGAELCGLSENELLGKNIFSFFPEEIHMEMLKAILYRNTANAETILEVGGRCLSVNATRFSDEGRVSYIAIVRDVTLQKKGEERVRRSLLEKDLMFKELNHRVKNNLSMIASMMALQEESLFDPRDAIYCQKVQNRVRSIAMVYEWMYRSEHDGYVDLNTLLGELITRFHDSVSVSAVPLEVRTGTEPVLANNRIAVPLAMSLAELITNADKYAFPHPDSESRVIVSLETRKEDGKPAAGILTVSDNGVGLPEDRKSLVEKSLGLKLIPALIEQIGGTVTVVSPPGTTFTIEFPLSPQSQN